MIPISISLSANWEQSVNNIARNMFQDLHGNRQTYASCHSITIQYIKTHDFKNCDIVLLYVPDSLKKKGDEIVVHSFLKQRGGNTIITDSKRGRIENNVYKCDDRAVHRSYELNESYRIDANKFKDAKSENEVIALLHKPK